jgi:hypothetical protein
MSPEIINAKWKTVNFKLEGAGGHDHNHVMNINVTSVDINQHHMAAEIIF